MSPSSPASFAAVEELRRRRPPTARENESGGALPLEQLLEQLAPRLDRLAAHVAPVEPQQIERREADAARRSLSPAEPLLQRLERRPPVLVDDARLAVDDALARRAAARWPRRWGGSGRSSRCRLRV